MTPYADDQVTTTTSDTSWAWEAHTSEALWEALVLALRWGGTARTARTLAGRRGELDNAIAAALIAAAAEAADRAPRPSPTEPPSPTRRPAMSDLDLDAIKAELGTVSGTVANYVETCHRQYGTLTKREAMEAAVSVATTEAIPVTALVAELERLRTREALLTGALTLHGQDVHWDGDTLRLQRWAPTEEEAGDE